ncbi:hypothetical protein SAY87_015233 [Trapa incisa]|uniref:BHLH domain-containing protein n=1 Tax=Trapa incisa TaxID=236973 RepID=A0AAN7H3J5_9MYRT|nr:hypothetical protein SAY87_015233 [Trapa incisa]
MERGAENQETRLLKDLKEQLALAVRSINWSYGIFWSISASEPRELEWGGGYYNGDIKTRKTVHAVEFNADELGLQRSEQLRQLYKSLSAGESGGQIRRPSAALSPEDLSDTEWYYLVCMSFRFDIGQGLPGRALSTGQSIWLCNADHGDSKCFSRSLLAKSASIQTVACFPFLGGVIELGVTDLVYEDSTIIQGVEASLLQTPNCRSSMQSYHGIIKTKMMGKLELISPTMSSDGYETYEPANEELMIKGTNVTDSLAQTRQLVDEEFGNCLFHSVNSSDCISQTFIDPGNAIQCLLAEDEMKGSKDDDVHYQSILSDLLKTSKGFIFESSLEKAKKESNFRTWEDRGSRDFGKSSCRIHQRMLKRVLLEVPWMHDQGLTESPNGCTIKKNRVWKLEAEETCLNHVLAERRRREMLNKQFYNLKSIIPSISKVDKVSILDDTIEYLKTLERRVEELEHTDSEETHGIKLIHDTGEEGTCDNNYGSNMLRTCRRPMINKRKATEMEIEIDCQDGLLVSVEDKEVFIEMKCKWKEGILLDILNTTSSLLLDSHAVESSTANGILSLSMRSKFVGSASPSAGTIRQVMQRFAPKGS